MAALEAVVAAVTTELRLLPGLVATPDSPPEQLSVFPALVIYPSSGFWRTGSAYGPRERAMRWGTHTLSIRLHIERSNLATDVAQALPYGELIADALLRGFARDRFGGTVVALGDPVTLKSSGGSAPLRYEFGPDSWGGIDTLAWKVALDVSVEEEINR